MDSNECKISNVRDFLVHLPRLARYEYNEAVSYLLWKVLNLSLEHGNGGVDWASFCELLESPKWRDGTYQRALRGSSWKKAEVRKARKGNLHVGTMCNRQCFPAETVYYCFTCTMNPLYELCEYCFDKDKHEGHVYTAKIVVRPEGRVCHCGNTSVFKQPHCVDQCRNPQNSIKAANLGANEGRYDQKVVETVSTLFDYLIDITVYSNEQDVKPSPVEYGRQKLDGIAKPELFLADSRGEVPDSKGSTEWALQIDEEDCQMRYMDLATKISRILNKPAEFAISITDKLQSGVSSVTVIKSFDRAKIESISTRFSNEGAKNHIRETRDTFKRSMVDDVIYWLYVLIINEATPLQTKKAVRLSVLDAWQSGLSMKRHSSAGSTPYVAKINLLGGFLVSYEQRETFPWFNPWRFSALDDPEVKNIMSNYDTRLADTNVLNSVMRYHPLLGSRFQYILTASADFLSRPSRYRMLKVLSSFFTIMDLSGKCLAAQYLDIYLAVLYSTVASDITGFKVSLMATMSQYTFQDPDTANLAIRRGFIQRVLRFAFNLMAFTSEDLVAYLPIPLYYGCKLPSESIKNRRTIICFKDICILMSTNTVPETLLEDDNILSAIIESFAEFNKILPLKRETSEHVEFENFDFSSYYFFFSSILILTDGYVRSVSLISDLESRRKIVMKLIKIAMDKEFELLIRFRRSNSVNSLNNEDLRAGAGSEQLSISQERICNHVSKTIKFQVGVDTQNFFNPMSYLFKFILQWSICGRYVPLPEHTRNYLNFKDLFDDTSQVLYISESALSTLVLLGQINVGFWVRNGTPITHQARMYTKYSMREFTYMSDIFNVQFSMATAEPNEFMVTFLARWGLKQWANGFPMGDYPDFETTVAVVNQCFLLLVQLMTEIKSLTVVSSVDGFQKTLRAEIIHALCFKNCTYSQIMNSIPEHITKHAAFDLYLEEYTNFTPPSGLTDCGVYTLKPEYRAEIDPFYVAMSPSKRYEVEKNIRMSMAVREGIDYCDTFIPAKSVVEALKLTPYRDLFAISSVETFGTFVKNTLDHIKKFECETILSSVIHLIHLCVVNNLNGFMKIFWHEYGSLDTEFCYYHSIGSILYDFLLHDGFSQVHGKIREIFRFLSRAAPHVDANSYLAEQVPSFSPDVLWSSNTMKNEKDGEFERKKALAKLRKKKLMKKIAKQQLQFMGNHFLSTSDEESCKESSQDLGLNQQAGWELPEDPCVFCKMPSAEDIFVYFSYQEQNICEHEETFALDAVGNGETTGSIAHYPVLDGESQPFITLSRIRTTHQAPVLRTCGHGSHISCLANHMKSIRSVHNQTTKNVPIAFGFGLMYCPLCNGLCNSFLPQLPNIFYPGGNAGIERYNTPSFKESNSLLLSTCVKAARVFKDLIHEPVESDGGLVNVISRILVNTTRNIELATRPESGDRSREISAQKSLVLRLLLALRDILQQHDVEIIHTPNGIPDWVTFISKSIDCDLLLTGSKAMTFRAKGGDEESRREQNVLEESVKELLKRKIYQDLLAVAKEMIKVDFYETKPEVAPWNVDEIPDSQFEIEKNSIACMFSEVVEGLGFKGRYVTQSSSFGAYIHRLLIQSLTVFLKRLYIIFHGRWAANASSEIPSTFPRKLEYFLSHFCSPSMIEIVIEFHQENFAEVLDLTKKSLADRLDSKLNNLSFICPTAIKLVALPDSLSEFFSSEDDNIMHRALKDDAAICLFCGKKCQIQKAVALHNYAIGACTNHVRNECPVNSTYGVFLLIRSNAIHLSYGERGTFYPAPYLHKHGEPDEDFKFNSPVYLDRRRYEHLKNGIILENMIPHIVFRLTDNNSDLGGWETM